MAAEQTLITANRQRRNAEERSHLDLQVNLLAEHMAKLIALVEELHRDLAMVRDRIDHEADAMQKAVDPYAMLEALERASESESPATGSPARRRRRSDLIHREIRGESVPVSKVTDSSTLIATARHLG